MVLRAVGDGGTGDWASIARRLVSRDARTVRQRYMDTLQNRSAAVRPWAAAEDEMLARAVRQVGEGTAWTAVAAFLPTRTAKQCSQRWYNHVRSQASREPWTPDEDRRLLALYAVDRARGRPPPPPPPRAHGVAATATGRTTHRAQVHGRRWRMIASLLGGRTPFQCRWRLGTALSPDRKDWTAADGQRLLELFREHGPQWAHLSRLLRARSDYELRKLFLREHKDEYSRWLREHDVAQRDRAVDQLTLRNRVRSQRTKRPPAMPAAASA